MKLTEKEKAVLRGWGHPENEIAQIEKALAVTVFERRWVIISAEQAKRLCGTEKFLSGLSRSAFHWTSERKDRYGVSVSFDSSKLFE